VETDPPPSFCPHCGLPDVVAAATDDRPIDVTAFGSLYRVGKKITVGSLCNIYRCEFAREGANRTGVFKIARDWRSNAAVVNEARVLRKLAAIDTEGKFLPFIPTVVESATTRGTPAEPGRQWNALDYDPAITSPDDLFTLAEVRAAHPNGLDPRDVAWMWRRLLHVLDFVHTNRLVHGAVLPPHVLIEPVEHKLVLIDWCFAGEAAGSAEPATDAAGFADWFVRDGVRRRKSITTDIATAARSMIYLLGSDDGDVERIPDLDPAIRRHFGRCMSGPLSGPATAGQILGEFDHLIEVLWGPRQFRPLTMPPKVRP
jgi:serine/threonine protein kinase